MDEIAINERWEPKHTEYTNIFWHFLARFFRHRNLQLIHIGGEKEIYLLGK